MLTLDQTTLFYFSLSDTYTNKDKPAARISDWASKIPHKPKAKRDDLYSTPSLTTGSSRPSGRPLSTVRSALTNNVKITQPDDDIEVVEGGLSDRDETVGPEYDVAMKSPPKGGRRATSVVSHLFYLVAQSNIILRHWSRSKTRLHLHCDLEYPRLSEGDQRTTNCPRSVTQTVSGARGSSRPSFGGLVPNRIPGASQMPASSMPCRRFAIRSMVIQSSLSLPLLASHFA